MRAPALLALSLLVAVPACNPPMTPVVSPPAAFSVPMLPVNENPDAIWVLRTVELSAEGTVADAKRTVGALFACYRKPATAPGPPDCYLTHYIWNPDDFLWPGAVAIGKDGRLVTFGTPAPPAK